MTTKSATKTKAFVKPEFINAPLTTLYSARVRLTDEERRTLKAAYDKAYNASVPTNLPPVGGSMVSVSTSYGSSRELDLALGMGRIAAVDCIQSRDSIALPLILKLQKVLGVEVVTPKRLEDAFQNYLAFLFTQD